MNLSSQIFLQWKALSAEMTLDQMLGAILRERIWNKLEEIYVEHCLYTRILLFHTI